MSICDGPGGLLDRVCAGAVSLVLASLAPGRDKHIVTALCHVCCIRRSAGRGNGCVKSYVGMQQSLYRGPMNRES